MTHPTQFSGCREAIQLLAEHGFDGLAEVIELLLNEVMKIERCEALGAAPYQRTEQRRGYANGYKDKTVHSRIGDLHLDVPQTRDVDFYPQALERGIRSERALTAALAEMYVQGVSTRKVSKIVEELCGHQVSSSTVSRLTTQLDEELQRWRERPLGGRRYRTGRHGRGPAGVLAKLAQVGLRLAAPRQRGPLSRVAGRSLRRQAAWGSVYRESLEGLIEQLGNDLGRDDLNVVIGRLSDFDIKNARYPQWTMVREAQVQVAEKHPSAAWIDTDDLNDGVNRRGAQIKDDLHYSAEGYKIFGKRMADAAIELIKARKK